MTLAMLVLRDMLARQGSSVEPSMDLHVFIESDAEREALQRKQAELTQLMVDTQRSARHAVVYQIRQLMVTHGLVVADLIEPGRGVRSSLADAPAPVLTKVAVQYRDPGSGEIWNGQGLLPAWLRVAMDAR